MTLGDEADLMITLARDRREANGRPFPPGWIDLVLAFSQQIQHRAPGHWIVTVRETDGVLDIDIDAEDLPLAARQMIAIYRDRSERTCAVCGLPGRQRIGSAAPWALCDLHDDGEPE